MSQTDITPSNATNLASVTDRIMDYECGALGDRDTVLLFADLVKTGMAFSLQGHYGRVAMALITEGVITAEGQVQWDVFNELTDF